MTCTVVQSSMVSDPVVYSIMVHKLSQQEYGKHPDEMKMKHSEKKLTIARASVYQLKERTQNKEAKTSFIRSA